MDTNEYQIIPNEFPINPRDYDTFTTIITANRQYGGGDFSCFNQAQLDQALAENNKAIEWSKRRGLYHVITAYIHSGISVRLDDYGNWPDQQWDCTRLGSIFIDPDKARHHLKVKRLTKAHLAQLAAILEGEFLEWKAWIEGDCYEVLSPDDDIVWSGTYDDCLHYIESLKEST